MLATRLLVLCWLLFTLGASRGTAQVADQPSPAPEFVSLFNGVDLQGWEGDPRFWSVKDGVIRGETTADNKTNGNTFLIWTEGRTKDFELRVTYRLTAANNSGIQYRSERIPADQARQAWVVKGYQYDLRNEVELPSVSGFIYDEGGKRGRMGLVGEIVTWKTDVGKQVQGQLMHQEEFKKIFRLDDWNEAGIIARGNHIQHFLNGVLVMEFTDEHAEAARGEGILALQLHGGAPMWVEFREVRYRALDQ